MARDRALVGVLLGAGLRAAELIALDVSDVDEDMDGRSVARLAVVGSVALPNGFPQKSRS
jgi:site-specific recombinase XerC